MIIVYIAPQQSLLDLHLWRYGNRGRSPSPVSLSPLRARFEYRLTSLSPLVWSVSAIVAEELAAVTSVHRSMTSRLGPSPTSLTPSS